MLTRLKILAIPMLALLPALVSPKGAHAAASAWIDSEGGRARLIALAPGPDGSRRGLVEIEPAPGWITYWREPGDSGIPPQLTLTPPASLLSLAFPAPKVLKLGGLTDIGYDRPVAFPVTLGGAPGRIEAGLFIGLCKEICIPFQANFVIEEGAPDRPEELSAVAAAQALVPPPTMDGLRLEKAALSPAGDAVLLDLALGEPEAAAQAVVTGPAGYAFTGAGKADHQGRLQLSVPLKGLSSPAGLGGHAWRALVMSDGRAIETEIPLK